MLFSAILYYFMLFYALGRVWEVLGEIFVNFLMDFGKRVLVRNLWDFISNLLDLV